MSLSLRLRRRLPALAAATALCPLSAALAEEEVVITATPLRSTPFESVQPASTLGGERLVERRAQSLGETLTSLPGVSASYFGPQASRPVLRGLSGERVQMYEDSGEALDVSALSNDHAVTIDPLAADRIEVVRGPAILLYGNGAVGGVVNVLTNRIPTIAPERPFAGAFEVRGDSGTDERAVAARAGGGGAGWAWHGDVFRRETGDVSIPDFATIEPLRPEEESPGRLANSGSDTQGGALGASRMWNSGFLGVSVSRFEAEYGLPGPEEEEDEEEDEADPLESAAFRTARFSLASAEGVAIDMAQTRYDLSGEWRAPVAALSALRLRATWNDYEHTEIEPGGEVGTRFDQEGYDVRLVADHAPIGRLRGIVGVQFRDADFSAVGEEAFLPPAETQNVGVFIYEALELDALTFEFGGRIESQESEPDAATGLPAYDEDATSFSAGVLWAFTDTYALALNLNATERHPTPTELFADGPHLAVRRFEIGDPSLSREKARSLDVGLRRAAGAWSFAVSAFLNDYDDYVYPLFTGEEEDGLPVVQYVQEDAEFTGIEAEVTLPSVSLGAARLETRLVADYVRAELDDGGDLPQIPPLRLGAEFGVVVDRLRVGLSTHWYDDQDRVSAEELPTPGYTMIDVDVSYRVPVADRTLLVFLRGGNLLDEDARRHTSPLKDFAPLPGRSIGAGFRFDF